jgi:hypothetical protein
MTESVQPGEWMNSPELNHSGAENILALLFPVFEPQFSPIKGLQSKEPEMPEWRLAGGLVNSLTKI